jgi:adenosylhomocysteinase
VTAPTDSDSRARLGFVADHMPLVGAIASRFGEERPFASMTLAVRIHVEAKTAVLIRALKQGGAAVVAMGNQGTTDDAIADVLRADGIDVFGSRADTKHDIEDSLDRLAEREPQIVLDNGAELIERLVSTTKPPVGATEETTSGAFRLRRHLAGSVTFPVIVINDSPLKAIVENKHGVGQSVVQVIQQTTNILVHRKRFIVFGYGWCGRGIALYARANGADVAVVEPDEIKALEASIDGFAVVDSSDAASDGDIFVTATGEEAVVTIEHMRAMRAGAIVANAGHFDTEIDMPALRNATHAEPRGPSIASHRFDDGHTIDVLAEGQMVNLAAQGSRGNAIEIMDLGFALQALSLERLVSDPSSLRIGDQPVPDDINRRIAADMVSQMMRR